MLYNYLMNNEENKKMETKITNLVFSPASARASKSRLYVSLENGLRDKVQAMGPKKYTALVTQVLKPYLAPATTLKFSRKAGCSCGCSPGFIVEGVPFKNVPTNRRPNPREDHWNLVDAHISLKEVR